MKFGFVIAALTSVCLVVETSHAGQLTTKSGCVQTNGTCVSLGDNEKTPKGSGSQNPTESYIPDGSGSSSSPGIINPPPPGQP